MQNKHVKGIVTAIKNGPIKTHKADGTPYKFPWHSSFYTIDNIVYKMGYVSANPKFPAPCEVGHEVEFDYTEKESDESGDIIREIMNDYNEPSKKTFKNLTRPSSGAGGFKGGYKSDPTEQARIRRAGAVNSAIEMLKHNLPGTQVKFENVKPLAQLIEGFILEAKAPNQSEAALPAAPVNPPPADIEPVNVNNFVDDEIPF